MKKVLGSVVMVAFTAFLVGCPDKKDAGGSGKEAITVTPPKSITVKQGDKKTEDGTLSFGEKASDLKSLTVKPVKDEAKLKVTVEPTSAKKSTEKVKFTVTAEADKELAVGEYDVTLEATPATGTATTHKITVKVEKK